MLGMTGSQMPVLNDMGVEECTPRYVLLRAKILETCQTRCSRSGAVESRDVFVEGLKLPK
jgi:hypothetical protein